METVGDIATILFLIDDNAPIEFVGEKGPEGNYRSGEVALKFKSRRLNQFLGEWADLKSAIDGAKSVAKEGDTLDGLPVETWAEETEKIFKLRQMQSPINADTSDGIKVRIRNNRK